MIQTICPHLPWLLDVDQVRVPLEESIARPVGRIRVRYVDVALHAATRVLYDTELAAQRREVSITVSDTIASPLIQWYPNDNRLPWLTAADGLHRWSVSDHAVTRLAYVPGRRVVYRIDDRVVKHYAEQEEFDTAAAAAGAIDPIRNRVHAPPLLEINENARLITHLAVDGQTPDRSQALAVLRDAAILQSAVATSGLTGLRPFTAADLLRWATVTSRFVETVYPQVSEALCKLRAQAIATAPSQEELQPAHGDFNVGQMIVGSSDLWLIDLDTLCAGSPSLDVASFVANLVSGRAGDLEDALACATALGRPGIDRTLCWYLAISILRRADRPFRRQKRDWRDRTDRIINAAALLLRDQTRPHSR